MSILAGEFEPGDRIAVDTGAGGEFSFTRQRLH